jgi:hypothetical protein
MATIAEIRQKYPQYQDLSDQKLADALYSKHYADMPRAEFDQKVGLVATPPPDLKPGSKEYGLWARDQAIAGNKLPQVSEAQPEYDGPAPHSDIGSKLHAAAGSFIEGVPIAGPTLIDLAKKGRAAVQNMAPEAVDREFAAAREANPISSGAGGLAGGVLPLLPLGLTQVGGRLLGTVGTTGQRIAAGGASGAALSGADTAARGGDIGQVALSAGIGAGLGSLFPVAGAVKNAIGNRTAQRAATNAAIKGAPAAADLKETARALFREVDASGVTVDTNRFSQFVADLASKAKKLRINPNLDPKATGAYQELIGALGDVQANGGALAISDLHTLRQIAQKAAMSTEGRDAMFANMIIEGLDDFVTRPGSTILPKNRLGTGTDAGSQLLKGISTWARARRVSMIEEAVYRAQNQASGVENGLRTQFRQILQNPEKRKLFTKAELAAIEDVTRGNAVSNLAKVLGMFGFNLGGSGGGNIIGGSLGVLFGGPVGFAVGAGSRKISEKLTQKAAERAAKVVATEGVPSLPMRPAGPALLPPAVVPLEINKKREPINITVRGGD